MKLAYVHCDSYFRSCSPLMHEYAAYFSRAGYQVIVFSFEQAPLEQSEAGPELRYVCGRPSKLRRLTFLFRLIREIRHLQVDLVHVFWSPGMAILPLFVGRKHIRWIVHVESGGVGVGWYSHLIDLLCFVEHYCFDTVCIVNEALRVKLFGNNTHRRIVVVPNGVDCKRMKSSPSDQLTLRRELAVPETARIVVYIGTHSPLRNLDRLLKSYQRVSRRCPDCLFLFVGGNVCDIGRLKKAAEKLGIQSQTRFAGYVSYFDIHRYLALADVAVAYIPANQLFDVQPPLKTIEYLAAGLPVVATNTVGNREYIVHEKTGLTTSADPDDVSRAITRLFSDDNLRFALGRAARESVRIYDWNNVIEKFLIPVYQQMDE